MPDKIFHPKIIKDKDIIAGSKLSKNLSDRISYATAWEIEEYGRQIASIIQEEGFPLDQHSNFIVIEWAHAAQISAAEIAIDYSTMQDVSEKDKIAMKALVAALDDLAEFLIDVVYDCRNYLVYDAGSYNRVGIFEEGMYYANITNIPIGVINRINNLCNYFISHDCVVIPRRVRYSLPLLINDVTTTYHTIISEYTNAGGNNVRLNEFIKQQNDIYRKPNPERIGNCTIHADSDPKMRTACLEWDKTVKKFNKNNVYLPDDYNSLQGTVYSKKWFGVSSAEYVVGSSAGHKAHLDIENGTVEYYDPDPDVNIVVNRLFESCGLSCEIRDNGVFCTDLNQTNVVSVTKRLAAVTTMDYRLRKNFDQYWGKFISSNPTAFSCLDYQDKRNREQCLVEQKLEEPD